MSEISYVDNYNRPIKYLTQWDQNIKIIIDDIESLSITSAPYVHFFNQKSKEALRVQSLLNNNILSVHIPNKLLREEYKIIADIYVTSEEEISGETVTTGESISTIEIPIRKRPKPSDDIYIDVDDSALVDTVPMTRTIAGISLENDITTSTLTNAILEDEDSVDALDNYVYNYLDENLTPNINNIQSELDDIGDKLGNTSTFDGILVIDSNGNIGLHIGSINHWSDEPYNRKYGWGGYPYGTGTLPPFSRIAGIIESDMLSVRGGKGRWNGDDTGNFDHGGHVFEGWNKEEDVRLTAGIGLNNKNIAFIQTFHPATESGTDNGAYYGITKIGSDLDGEGADFLPKVTQMKSPMVLWQRPMSYTPTIPQEQFDLMVDTGEVASSMAKSTDMMFVGAMYYDTTLDRVRVYSKQGWKTLAWEEE